MPYALKRTPIDGGSSVYLGSSGGLPGWYPDINLAQVYATAIMQAIQRWRMLNDVQTKQFRIMLDQTSGKYRIWDPYNRALGRTAAGVIAWRLPNTAGFVPVEFDAQADATIANWGALWARRTPDYQNYNYEIEST